MRRSLCIPLLLAAAAATPAVAAQPRPRPAPRVAPADPDEVPPGWAIHDREALLARINATARAQSPRAAEEIARVLTLGVEPAVAQAGLEALASLGRPEGAEAVRRYLTHRRALLRRHAVIAARGIGGNALVRAVEARLTDPDAAVRLEAARALGVIGDGDAMVALWRATERDLALGMQRGADSLTAAALTVLGARAPAPTVERVLGLLGRVPLPVLDAGLRAALLRNDLDAALKMRVVREVAQISTQDARTFLQGAADHATAPAPWVDAARRAAERIR